MQVAKNRRDNFARGPSQAILVVIRAYLPLISKLRVLGNVRDNFINIIVALVTKVSPF